ncbi:glycosyltransferase family 2 protein [Halomicronema sp. CCY15110]|uniref:glycosyltransferase family 2 protein n=1 Tax=Halomicronema sp. CCY15110 TaxID=2767773 RepID=UPI001951D161|nr:glycosyltransferase family 2 protein [Halomicronema sp. CCY15110]
MRPPLPINHNSLVTIGIPCFNAQDTIARAIHSALHQDWPHCEILIVDDCSTDRSVAVIETVIQSVEANIRLIQHPQNQGPAASRNTILRAARGEFIAFFDDDDEGLPGRITGQLQVLREYEQNTGAHLVACYASGHRYYPNGYEKPLPAIGSRPEGVPHGPGLADYLLTYRQRSDWFYGSGTPTCALLARASTFAAIGGFDEKLRRVEDADLAIRLALKGGHFIGTTDCLFNQYSTHAADKSYEKNLVAEQQIAQKHRAYLETINRYYYALHWPKLRYWHFKRQYHAFVWELLQLWIRHPIAVSQHLWATGPQRLRHEQRMTQKIQTSVS